MSEHTTLYRKWRPSDFTSVVGQDHITDVLKYQVENGRTSHAYLFCGSRGTGKTTCAKILAKAINCESPENGNPCGKCASCNLIEDGIYTDIIEMDAASNNGVDYIRDIRDEVIYTPAVLKKKVYIIDEVHMLSSGAFNALLKTLEEPPSHVVFILATTELQKLPATITSRCQRFDFKRISSDDIASRLEYIALKENISLTHEAAKLIGRISQGGMRDSISLLELCSSTGLKVDMDRVRETAGVMGRDKCESAVMAIKNKEIGTLFTIIEQIFASSNDVLSYFSELIEYLRDMLVIKSLKSSKEYLDLTDDEYNATKRIADAFTSEKILLLIKNLESSMQKIKNNDYSKRVTAELTLISLTDDRLSSGYEALQSRISSLEEKIALGAFSRPQEPTSITQKSVSDVTKNTVIKEKVETELKPLPYWNEVIETVSRSDSSSAGHLKLSRGYTDGEDITVKVQNSFTVMLLDNNALKELICAGINLSDESMSVTPNKIKFTVEKAETNNEDDPLLSL